MAEDKKSIIVYSDWMKKFDSLSDDEAGRLIKHFFRYVNDLNPVAPDRLTEIAFIDIEQCLKRDLKKWEVVKETKSKGGVLGNLKRWNLDLYNKVISKELTVDEATVIADGRKTSDTDNKDRTESQDIANIAVNDSVNVNVIKKEVITPVVPTVAIDYYKFIEIFNSFANRKFRVTKKVKFSLSARLKEYSKDEILAAIKNAHSNQYHIETNFEYLTPEFILRPDKLEKFLNLPKQAEPRGYTPQLTN